MITGISIENFKGIRERVDIDLRPITLLFGPNSAGKSTILHALQYAREIFEKHNLDVDRTVSGGMATDLGGFRTFVHGRDADRSIRLGFKVRMENRDDDLFQPMMAVSSYLATEDWAPMEIDYFGAVNEAEVAIRIAWSHQHQRAYVAECSIAGDGEWLAEISSDPDGRRILLRVNPSHSKLSRLRHWIDRDAEPGEYRREVSDRYDDPDASCLSECLPAFSRLCEITSDGAFFLDKLTDALPDPTRPLPFAQKPERPSPDEWFDDCLAMQEFETDMVAGISRLVLLPLREVVEFLETFRYLGPLRETPPRNYQPPKFPDAARWSSGLGAWDALHLGTDEFVALVGEWLGADDRLNSGHRIARRAFKEIDLADPLVVRLLTGRAFDEAESGDRLQLEHLPTLSRIVITPEGSELELRPHDVGTGISQVVPVVVTALEGEHRLLAIEQPELHLHPKLQAELGDLFIASALGETGHIVLLETHSEHLILRLQRRIRETTKGTPHCDQRVTSGDVLAYYIGREDGTTTVTEMAIDKDGEFVRPWPDDFFEIDFYERFS